MTQAKKIGKYTRVRTRRGKAPVRIDRCLMPGKTKPVRCPDRLSLRTHRRWSSRSLFSAVLRARRRSPAPRHRRRRRCGRRRHRSSSGPGPPPSLSLVAAHARAGAARSAQAEAEAEAEAASRSVTRSSRRRSRLRSRSSPTATPTPTAAPPTAAPAPRLRPAGARRPRPRRRRRRRPRAASTPRATDERLDGVHQAVFASSRGGPARARRRRSRSSRRWPACWSAARSGSEPAPAGEAEPARSSRPAACGCSARGLGAFGAGRAGRASSDALWLRDDAARIDARDRVAARRLADAASGGPARRSGRPSRSERLGAHAGWRYRTETSTGVPAIFYAAPTTDGHRDRRLRRRVPALRERACRALASAVAVPGARRARARAERRVLQRAAGRGLASSNAARDDGHRALTAATSHTAQAIAAERPRSRAPLRRRRARAADQRRGRAARRGRRPRGDGERVHRARRARRAPAAPQPYAQARPAPSPAPSRLLAHDDDEGRTAAMRAADRCRAERLRSQRPRARPRRRDAAPTATSTPAKHARGHDAPRPRRPVAREHAGGDARRR